MAGKRVSEQRNARGPASAPRLVSRHVAYSEHGGGGGGGDEDEDEDAGMGGQSRGGGSRSGGGRGNAGGGVGGGMAGVTWAEAMGVGGILTDKEEGLGFRV